jgi:hypothetical protein
MICKCMSRDVSAALKVLKGMLIKVKADGLWEELP